MLANDLKNENSRISANIKMDSLKLQILSASAFYMVMKFDF